MRAIQFPVSFEVSPGVTILHSSIQEVSGRHSYDYITVMFSGGHLNIYRHSGKVEQFLQWFDSIREEQAIERP